MQWQGKVDKNWNLEERKETGEGKEKVDIKGMGRDGKHEDIGKPRTITNGEGNLRPEKAKRRHGPNERMIDQEKTTRPT